MGEKRGQRKIQKMGKDGDVVRNIEVCVICFRFYQNKKGKGQKSKNEIRKEKKRKEK